jgi:hypothetical protein
MSIQISRWLNKSRQYRGQQAGRALVAWLNDRQSDRSWLKNRSYQRKLIEELLQDANVVFRILEKYPNDHEFYVAAKKREFPRGFYACRERLNKMLRTFKHEPWIELHGYYEEAPLTWTITEESPMALVAPQIGWILHLINDRAVLKVRRCQQCTKWYFGRFSHQNFCSSACRGKHFSRTEPFKEKRRKYMREYYHLKKSGKVK